MTVDRGRVRSADSIHVPFVTASLLFGIFGGFTLAVTLPLEVLLGSPDRSWVAHAQVHGHLQAVGFAGLFVLGMGLRLAPRFGSGRLAFPGLVRPGFALLAAGLLLRAIGQPLAGHVFFSALLASGAFAELTGATIFAAIFAATLAPAVRKAEPNALLLLAAVSWFLVQAAFGAWWLLDLALDGGIVLPATEDQALVNLQVFGMVLSAILGVGMRVFPTFFGMPAPRRGPSLVIAVLVTGGLIVWTMGTLLPSGNAGEGLTSLGTMAVGIAILGAVATFGFGRLRHRMAEASRGYIWALQPVLFWMALTGVGLLAAGARGLLSGEVPSAAGLDALRHVFTVGVVTLAIVTMAQLILPEFASERITQRPAAWRGAAFGGVLSVAALLRGGLPWADRIHGDDHYRAMAAAGLLALFAVAAFGLLYWRARRRHRVFTRRAAAMRARSEPVAVVQSAPPMTTDEKENRHGESFVPPNTQSRGRASAD